LLERAFDFLLFSNCVVTICLVSSVVANEQLTLDGLVASYSPAIRYEGPKASAPDARKRNACTLYLVFKEPRTSAVFLPAAFPRPTVIHFIGYDRCPFWGNLSNLRRFRLPCQSLFRILAKISSDDFTGSARFLTENVA
jgi:hypothetical protein